MRKALFVLLNGRRRLAVGAIAIAATGTAVAVAASDPANLSDADLRAALENTRFIAFKDALRAEVEFFEDGAIYFRSPFGSAEGEWVAADETVCIYFDEGPMRGETCTTLTRESQTLIANDGTMLISISTSIEP